ncbi:hypothetical protein [Streptomyces sp. NPDC020742]|uniref:LppU/SCO3897 family protein n=1 Tax=Streptomyces sp. NPDC020742 TaxID=3154897 RepID=UPI003407DCCB
MSAPPPYQNHPPQQPYGHPQQPYGQQQQAYGQQQQPYGYAQQPAPVPPQQRPPQPSLLRGLITAVIVLAVFGGVGWYVWDYNTNPSGGKAKKEAAQAAKRAEEKTHDPQSGDCVKVEHPNGDPLPTIVDCGSSEAQYKAGERLYGAGKECRSPYTYQIQVTQSRGIDYTMCFTKV